MNTTKTARLVARNTEDVRVLLALRAIPTAELCGFDQRRLAGLERVTASRLRVAFRVAAGE